MVLLILGLDFDHNHSAHLIIMFTLVCLSRVKILSLFLYSEIWYMAVNVFNKSDHLYFLSTIMITNYVHMLVFNAMYKI